MKLRSTRYYFRKHKDVNDQFQTLITLLQQFSFLYPIHKLGRGPDHPLFLASGSMMFTAILLPPVFAC